MKMEKEKNEIVNDNVNKVPKLTKEELIQREKSRQEGRVEQINFIVDNMYQNDFDIATICEIVSLPKQKVTEILIQKYKDMIKAKKDEEANKTSYFSKDELMQIELWRQEEQERAYRSDMSCARDEGKEIGIKQGKKELRESIVCNMYKNNFDIGQIALAVSLMEEKVKDILTKSGVDIK